MAGTDTLIFRAALHGSASIYRDIELDPSKSLYVLAEAIVSSFNFDFDHAFGFYTGLTPAKLHKTFPKYELFADMGDADPRVLGVKKTRISEAFFEIGHTMLFLFDYGDGWLFQVTLRTIGKKSAKTRYPRVVATRGEAPAQYPHEDDEPDDQASF
jgi:Plasmid pRiA4b ORF-3-like protein